jgi:hypothetical protein
MSHGHLDYFKNRLLEVGLTQNQEIMTLRTLIIVVLFYFTMCEDPHEDLFIEVAFGKGPGHMNMTSHWLRDHTT